MDSDKGILSLYIIRMYTKIILILENGKTEIMNEVSKKRYCTKRGIRTKTHNYRLNGNSRLL